MYEPAMIVASISQFDEFGVRHAGWVLATVDMASPTSTTKQLVPSSSMRSTTHLAPPTPMRCATHGACP